jgi:hypothetical protein
MATQPTTSTAGPGTHPEIRTQQVSSRIIPVPLLEEAAWRISSTLQKPPRELKNMMRKCERKIASANGCNRAHSDPTKSTDVYTTATAWFLSYSYSS